MVEFILIISDRVHDIAGDVSASGERRLLSLSAMALTLSVLFFAVIVS